MPKRKDEDNRGNGDDWIGVLIALGIGAIAIHFFSKMLDKSVKQNYNLCSYCGNNIKKWSRVCPNCGKVLTWR